MYDHLPPRLAKYLAAIYTGTSVQEIERQDTESIIEAKIITKLLRWNKQRGQKINQLNQRIHEQRLEMRKLRKQIDVFNGVIERKNKMLDDLVSTLYSERRRARELRVFAHETTRRLTEVATDASETFIEHDSDWKFK